MITRRYHHNGVKRTVARVFSFIIPLFSFLLPRESFLLPPDRVLRTLSAPPLFPGWRFLIGPPAFTDDVTPGLMFGDHAVDGAPVGQTTDVTVVDEEIDFQLPGEMLVTLYVLLGEVAVHGIEIHAALMAPVDGLLQELALPA